MVLDFTGAEDTARHTMSAEAPRMRRAALVWAETQ